jgi:hypothetical protein
LTVGLCWIRGQYFFASWPRLLSIANWGTDCVVRMLLQKQVDLAGDIPIYRKNKCRSSFGIFILKILKINVGICWKSKNNFSTKIQRLPEPQTASKVPSSGSSTGKSTWSFARVLQRPLIVSVCVCACAYICAYIFLCACVYLCFYIYVCEWETLHDSCQTQLSASLSCKMEKFSHSSFKEKVTSRRFSRRCYGDRSSQDHVAPPLKRRCSGGDGGGCLEHPGCGPTSYSYSFSSKDWTWDASRFMPDSTLSVTFLQDGEVQPFEFQREGHIEKIFSQMLWWQIKSRSCHSTPIHLQEVSFLVVIGNQSVCNFPAKFVWIRLCSPGKPNTIRIFARKYDMFIGPGKLQRPWCVLQCLDTWRKVSKFWNIRPVDFCLGMPNAQKSVWRKEAPFRRQACSGSVNQIRDVKGFSRTHAASQNKVERSALNSRVEHCLVKSSPSRALVD